MIQKFRLIAIELALVTVSFTACSKSKRGESKQTETNQKQYHSPLSSSRMRDANLESEASQKESERPHKSDSFHAELLDELKRQWDEAATQYKGEELLHRQWEIEKRITSLGPGDALLQFFEFLATRGANDTRERVTSEIGNAIFSGKDAQKAREWLATVPDKELRVRLCRYAGKHHPGPGLKELLVNFHPDDQCQSAILTAYCKNLAKTDPSSAVKTFVDLRPSNVNFSGIAEVMAALPPKTSFAAISATLPSDTHSIARRARAALLRSWVAASPEDAAQYVIANTTVASPEQMGVVVQAWCMTSPENATAWIEALSPGKPKNEGSCALAVHWAATDPVKAWDFATKVGDFDKKVETATLVFKEWEKKDRDAATRAWIALFPPAKQ